jgi:hypothetical protein
MSKGVEKGNPERKNGRGWVWEGRDGVDTTENERKDCTHRKEDPIYVFPKMKLLGLVPNFNILVSVSDLYIPRM